MDLLKIEPLDSRSELEKIEGQAITSRWRATIEGAHATACFTYTFGCIMGISAFMVATTGYFRSFGFLSGFLLLLTAMFGLVGAGAAVGIYALSPTDRRKLRLLFEPQAKAFFLKNADRRELLLDRSSAFNDALAAFKALPARTNGDEIDCGVVENLVERRKTLEAEIADYIEEFRCTTEDDRLRVAALDAARAKPKSARKRALAAFNVKLDQLRALEEAVDGLQDLSEQGTTVDLSPYVAAQRLRSELQEEREALAARGYRPKKLPKSRGTDRKTLPAAT